MVNSDRAFDTKFTLSVAREIPRDSFLSRENEKKKSF